MRKDIYSNITLPSIDEALNEYKYLCAYYEDVVMNQFIVDGSNMYMIRYRFERDE